MSSAAVLCKQCYAPAFGSTVWKQQTLMCCSRICCSCGAMSHKTKECMERPRRIGAKFTNKYIAADEKVLPP